MKKEKQKEKETKKISELEQSKPNQMTLFEILAPEEKKYSNTIEFYDFMPKYFYGKTERVQGKFLNSLVREWECRGQGYNITISPASVKDENGEEKYFYPGKREELVEDALRKLAVEGQGLFIDQQAGVTFSLYQLQQELKRTGHSYSVPEIKEALFVCVRANITVTTENGKAVISSSLFEAVGLNSKEDWEGQGKKESAFIKFNSLVTESIKQCSFRQINYEKIMTYDNVIARQLHKRMSHHFIQAALVAPPYTIKLSTIIRNFGITAYEYPKHNLRDVIIALKEMEKKKVIREYQIQEILDYNKKNMLIDAKIDIYPDVEFIDDVVKANEKAKQRIIKSVGLTPRNPKNL